MGVIRSAAGAREYHDADQTHVRVTCRSGTHLSQIRDAAISSGAPILTRTSRIMVDGFDHLGSERSRVRARAWTGYRDAEIGSGKSCAL